MRARCSAPVPLTNHHDLISAAFDGPLLTRGLREDMGASWSLSVSGHVARTLRVAELSVLGTRERPGVGLS